jgi:serine/threonine protein kinase
VAVKRLTKSVSNSALLVNEIKTLQRVQGHPNVVNLISTSEDNDSLFLTTALCPNGSLFDYILKSGPVPEHVARQWAYELFDALRHCHERGVVNRDLKPENILLDDSMSLVIADFGLAAIVENAEARNLVTATGSPVFAAPEVHRAQKAAYSGGPADMFSAGCVLHCCLAGELPFDVDTYTTEWAGYRPPEHVSPQCHELLYQLLSVDPARRPTAAKALQSEWVRGHRHRARLLMAPVKSLPM